MRDKKARKLRKLVEYNPGEDPIKNRKYAVVVTKKNITPGSNPPYFVRAGRMIANKEKRLQYRAAKKAYKNGQLKGFI